MAGMVYGAGAVALGTLYLAASIAFLGRENERRARALLFASLVYLPLLFASILLDPTVRATFLL